VKGVSSLKLHVYERATFLEKTLYKRESIMTLGQSLLMKNLVRSFLPPPGHSDTREFGYSTDFKVPLYISDEI